MTTATWTHATWTLKCPACGLTVSTTLGCTLTLTDCPRENCPLAIDSPPRP